MRTKTKQQNAFTIVELLIVIVIIGILAAITVVAYNGIQERAKVARRDSDTSNYYKAILAARVNTGRVLKDITGSSWSVGNCATSQGNPGNVTPKDLPKTHICWTSYYLNLDRISAASGMNLDSLKTGDANGNPYGLDENEGEGCSTDRMYYFNGFNANYTEIRSIPMTAPCP